MLEFFEKSPYAVKRDLSGEEEITDVRDNNIICQVGSIKRR